MAKILTLKDYYKGRDVVYKKDLTSTIIKNATHTVACFNKLLKLMEEDGVDTSSAVFNSGWRPAAVNNATKGADPNSPHVTAEAGDLGDVNGRFKKWVSANPEKVLSAGFVATEDPKITSTWCHLQTRPKLKWQAGRALWEPVKGGWRNCYSKAIKKSLV